MVADDRPLEKRDFPLDLEDPTCSNVVPGFAVDDIPDSAKTHMEQGGQVFQSEFVRRMEVAYFKNAGFSEFRSALTFSATRRAMANRVCIVRCLGIPAEILQGVVGRVSILMAGNKAIVAWSDKHGQDKVMDEKVFDGAIIAEGNHKMPCRVTGARLEPFPGVSNTPLATNLFFCRPDRAVVADTITGESRYGSKLDRRLARLIGHRVAPFGLGVEATRRSTVLRLRLFTGSSHQRQGGRV
jgi:hypothetical protein